MVIHKATIARSEESTALVLTIGELALKIILTEDKPNEVKAVFNKLISELKKEEFNVNLKDEPEDLYYHISKEYITQLNSDLSSVYNELSDFKLLKTD